MHCAVWLPHGTKSGATALRNHWLAITEGHRSLERGQHVERIHELHGWLMYVGKHAARGVEHYQRATGSLPSGWESTGRLWGHRGKWMEPTPLEFDLSAREFWKFRRLHKRLAVSRAREVHGAKARQVVAIKRSLRCNDRARGEVMGLSAWTNREGEEFELIRAVLGEPEWQRRLAITTRTTLESEASRTAKFRFVG